MSLVTRTTDTGLTVAEEAGGEASVSASLRLLDRRLFLAKRPDSRVAGGWAYKVMLTVSEEPRRTRCLFTWMDDACNPLPLTHGLVTEFQRYLKGERGNDTLVDADEHNRRHQERLEAQRKADGQAIFEEHAPRLIRDRVVVSLGTMQKLPYWQRSRRR